MPGVEVKRVLVTGFEPFGGEKINASWEAVSRLPDKVGGIEIVKARVPVVVYKSVDAALEAARAHNVDAILAVGESGANPNVQVEFIGTNWLSMSIPDNDGNQVRDGLSYPEGPDAHFATIPASKIATEARKSHPVALSLSAGAYVCNHLMYGLLERGTLPAGFVHVPVTEDQDKGQKMPVETTVECLKAIILQLGVQPQAQAQNEMAAETGDETGADQQTLLNGS